MRRRARVLSVIGDLGFGGAEHRLLALARNIDRELFDHSVITINQADPDREETCAMRRCFAESGVELKDLGEGPSGAEGGSPWSKGSRLARRVRKLSRVIAALDVDVVDAHLEPAALVGTISAMLTGRPRAVTLYHPRPLVPKRFWMLAQQIILNNAGLVLTDSEVRARELQSAARLRAPEVRVIPNGIPPPEAARSRDEMRAALALPEDPHICVIGQIGALVEFKGQMVLVEAARSVLEKAPHAYFLIVGYSKHEPHYRRRLEARAAELGISERVKIVSYPGPIGDVWGLIDIHAHASTFDSLPNAVIEGMSLGKPAVVTAVGGVPDAVEHGRSGLVVPPGDAGAFADALLEFLRRPEFARECGEAALRRYMQQYRADLTARRLERCFLDLLAADARRPRIES